MGKKLLFIPFLILLGYNLSAQKPLEQQYTLYVRNISLEDALYVLVDRRGVKLSFSNDIIPQKLVSLIAKEKSLDFILTGLLEGTDVSYKTIGQQIVLFRRVESAPPPRHSISGFLEDAASGERLIGANVYDAERMLGTMTNEYGFFSLSLPEGINKLIFSYIGYEADIRNLNLTADLRLDVTLKSSLQLQEIVITATDSILTGRRGNENVDIISGGDINRLPSLAGESDLIRTLHLLPGIQTGTDGVGGLHIRGGNPGQNLMLIDGVPVYNISHAASIFSIFNTGAIRSAKLVKGGFSARYGGRVSSVLDVRTKEGNKRSIKGKAEIGALTARLSLEGPVFKGKSAFFISGRKSFLNWYLEPMSEQFKRSNDDDGRTGYQFYDLNVKYNFTISKKDKVYFSFYKGSDHFSNLGTVSTDLSLENSQGQMVGLRFDRSYDENIRWGNAVSAFRWNHLLSDKLFLNTTLTFSRLNVGTNYNTAESLYLSQLGERLGDGLIIFGDFRTGITDAGLRFDFDYAHSPVHFFKFGFNSAKKEFEPGASSYRGAFDDFENEFIFSNEQINNFEYAFYLEDEMHLNRAISLTTGLRLAGMHVNEKKYISLEPRVSFFWRAGRKTAFKASFSKMTQYLHLLSNSGYGLPTDLWVPSTDNIEPETAWQFTSGLDFDIGKDMIFGLEGYYKAMNGLLNFSEGAFQLQNWQENVTSGTGKSYGLEVFYKKTAGKTKGWLAYTLSRTTREFEKINIGRVFPYKFDRRHDFKIALTHSFSSKFQLSANWVYSTGFAYSIPLVSYVYEDPGSTVPPITVNEFGKKNAYRMPAYHRLDMGIHYYIKDEKLSHTIYAGVYNLYNKKNPLYYDLRTQFINVEDKLEEKKQFVEVWLLPILPSLSYSVSF